jgi:hypothetical protein
MERHGDLLEPFDAETLEVIQTAFRAGWHELCNGCPVPNPAQLRNRLAGTIAHLARAGITDPLHLKEKALQRVALAARLN